jgi:SecD/SecF fusion protein
MGRILGYLNSHPEQVWMVLALLLTVAILYAANRFLTQFYWRIATCVIPLIIGGLIVGIATHHYLYGEPGMTFKPGPDLVGGTILVYEVDTTKFPDGRVPPNVGADLAAALKRRIDPADLKNITIRPVSNTRVEIVLPTGGTHEAAVELKQWDAVMAKVAEAYPPPEGEKLFAPVGDEEKLASEVKRLNKDVDYAAVLEYIQKINTGRNQKKSLTAEEVQRDKELITQIGSLEFRIVANDRDDAAAFEAAKKFFEEAKTNAAYKRQLEEAAMLHNPPPRVANGETFPVKLSTGTYKYSYSWVELGRLERKSLQLSNAQKAGANWQLAADGRKTGMPVQLPMGALLFSREVQFPDRLAPKDRSKEIEYFLLTRDAEPGREITGKFLVGVNETESHGGLAVGFHFDNQGGQLFQELTTRNRPEDNFHRFLAIVLDGKIESAPRLNAIISTDGVIEGDFTKDEVDRYVRVLRAGQLPATLNPTPVSESTMGATLGEDTIMKGTVSVGIAFVAILLFMLVYYRFAGLVACVALLANLLLTIAFMVAVQATFTLPGLAGLVLMLGMAVDANVLIYERLREERDRGASLALAIRNGYDRAFPTIIDTHLSSIFTAIVLYAVGNDQLKGFGISLTVGLIISLFTSLFMTRLMFDLWLAKGWLHKLSMLRLFSRPNIDFMRIRYYWFTATILLTIFGAAVFILRLPNDLNIDFNGGTAYGGQLSQPLNISELRALLNEKHQGTRLEVVKVEPTDGGEGYQFNIFYKDEELPRSVRLPERSNVDEVKARASILPDMSVEQIFKGYAAGDRTDLFTVRTSEKSPEMVQASVSRLLGDKLKRILMDFKINEAGRTATLDFLSDQPDADNKYAYASPSQVSGLLERKLKEKRITTPVHVSTEAEYANPEDRYRQMKVTLTNAIDPAVFEDILKATQAEFKDRPQPDRIENFDSQLAATTQKQAGLAVLFSWGAILLYLWFRFGSWTFGLAAVLCLIHDLFFTLGIIAFAHYIHLWAPPLARVLLLEDFKIDLPAVAALLTLVGYSVNDTIVVFDRIREVRGKNPELTAQMINDSVNQTLSRTLLTSFATWLVVIVLYIAGGEGVHLFSFVMVVGVIVGTYSSIYIASPLLLIFGEGAPAKKEERKPQPAQVPA